MTIPPVSPRYDAEYSRHTVSKLNSLSIPLQ
jgi:hypothetical protein